MYLNQTPIMNDFPQVLLTFELLKIDLVSALAGTCLIDKLFLLIFPYGQIGLIYVQNRVLQRLIKV